jgi:hypothetical protein
MMSKPKYAKTRVAEVVNDHPPGAMNTFSAVGDVNGSGWLDIVVCGRNGKMVWLENRGKGQDWEQHLIDEIDRMECGGCLYDLTGNGLLDIVNGGDSRCDEIYWWENPGIAGVKWQRRLIAKTWHTQFHDTAIGDVTGDGSMSLVFSNQRGGTTIYRLPLPPDPTVSLWPGLEIVAANKTEVNQYREDGEQPEEGLALGDIDGDGLNEIICGTHWYKRVSPECGEWRAHKFASGYITTKVALGDIDGDGMNEIVLSEGDPCVYGQTEGGKLAWFKPGDDNTAVWKEHILDEFLLDAHSLQLGDICGNGRVDIVVGEVGMGDTQTDEYVRRAPRIMVYENEGLGRFRRHIVDEGTGIHDAVLADMGNRDALDIVGKPLHGPEKWRVHVYYRSLSGAE